MTTQQEVQTAVENQVQELLDKTLNPPVKNPRDVNEGFCWHFAERVYERLGKPDDVRILGTGIMNHNHRWIEHNGYHYDSEAITGVEGWRNIPSWDRIDPHDEVEVTEVGERNR